MELEKIKLKLFDKLKPSGWDSVFKSFIFSPDFDDILQKLYNLSQDDKRFTPPLKQVFRAFEECPYDKLKVIIIGQDPYPQLGVADGIAFSCSNTDKLQPSLKFILQEVDRTVYKNHVISENLNLRQSVWITLIWLFIQCGIGVYLIVGSPYIIKWQMKRGESTNVLNTPEGGEDGSES